MLRWTARSRIPRPAAVWTPRSISSSIALVVKVVLLDEAYRRFEAKDAPRRTGQRWIRQKIARATFGVTGGNAHPRMWHCSVPAERLFRRQRAGGNTKSLPPMLMRVGHIHD